MIRRRQFGRGAIGLAGGSLLGMRPRTARAATTFSYERPPVSQRGFSNPAIERTLATVLANITDPSLAAIFTNTYPFATDNYVTYTETAGVPDTYVSTGDIAAMWLRDSSAELFPFISASVGDRALRQLLVGLIHRQARCILVNPYAESFTQDLTVYEDKFELDSLCWPVRFAFNYWLTTGDRSGFDTDWFDAAQTIVATMRQQQRPGGTISGPYQYTGPFYAPNNGYGNPIKPDGLIVSVFRPSDDPTNYSFLVPSNFFAVSTLLQIAIIAAEIYNDGAFASSCAQFADQLTGLLQKHARAISPSGQKIWAYEVDGFGDKFLADDANLPNLLSLPYIAGIGISNPTYQATREFSLSPANPYYRSGPYGSGLGSEHTDPADNFWTLGLTAQAITSQSPTEIAGLVTTLINTTGGTGLMHESVDVSDPTNYTRQYFGWANQFFAELMLKLNTESPSLLRSIKS